MFVSARAKAGKIVFFSVDLSGIRRIDGLEWFKSDVFMCYALLAF